MTASKQLLGFHYAQHESEDFYLELISFMCSGPLIAMCLEGENVITLSRQMIGHFVPEKCLPGTIRGDWSQSQIESGQ